jgi:hypothetical protein
VIDGKPLLYLSVRTQTEVLGLFIEYHGALALGVFKERRRALAKNILTKYLAKANLKYSIFHGLKHRGNKWQFLLNVL